ncbi:VWA domain-containing protein [Ascidiimonas sp. W6]|uniref:VWA domain-containing protein n=1 Tax=Ascidiimonas meishanensis TaxID=3128903 RepID=UPI0030ED454B
MQLEEKIFFNLLFVIPIIIVAFIMLQIWKRKTQRHFASAKLLRKLTPSYSVFKSVLKIVIICLSIAFISIALVNPRIGTKLETIKREGVDVVFAVDVSKSMLAEDIAPNRLEKSKRLVSEIIGKLGSDRIGIIAYAAQAVPQLPITTDYAAAKMFLQSLNTDMLSSQGTAIDEAIDLAKTYYNDEEQTNRVLFIISDGEDHSDGAVNAVEDAVNEGIKIFTIGVGTPKGGVIPEKINGIVNSYKKTMSGEVVITKLNESILQEIAKEGNGAYINGKDTEETVSFVVDMLAQMDKKQFEAKQYADFKDQFQWFLGAAILLLFLDIFLLERKTAWLEKLNLFNEKEL